MSEKLVQTCFKQSINLTSNIPTCNKHDTRAGVAELVLSMVLFKEGCLSSLLHFWRCLCFGGHLPFSVCLIFEVVFNLI